jgi:WD40 repeat protein
MSPDEEPEEELTTLLAAGDDALAAGAAPEQSVPGGVPTEQVPRLQEEFAFLRLLRQALRPEDGPPTRPAAPDGAAVLPPVLGRFQVQCELGRGTFGVVVLAHDPLLARDVALKLPRAEAVVTPELRARFQREARAAAALEHPNLVPVYEVCEVGPVCFLVSAYCPGLTLARWLKERSEPVPFRLAAALVATLAEAVQHAHSRNVVHRDLKPGNVLLSPSPADGAGPAPPGEGLDLVPRVTDFGLAKVLTGPEQGGEGPPTRSGVIVGTVSYMAPEQAAGKVREVGAAADIYALGAILYECLTGRPPFRGETDLDTLLQVQMEEAVSPSRLRPRIPRDLATMCLSCLHKEPARRYATAGALADDLRRFLAGRPVAARPVGGAERLWRWCRRHPSRAAATGLAGVLVLAVVALGAGSAFALRLRQEQEQTREALRTAETYRREAEHLSASFALERGLNLADQGDVARGLLWLAHVLELAPADDAEVQRAARANLADGYRRLHPLRAAWRHDSPALAAVFSPDGRTVLTRHADHSARLWDTATGAPVAVLSHDSEVEVVTFSPDGRMVLTGTWGARHGAARLCPGTVRLWRTGADGQTQPGEPLPFTLPHRNWVMAIAISPDGQTILTGSCDRTAQLWEAATGKPLGKPLEHPSAVFRAVLSPDGRSVLTGCKDGTVRLWDAATQRPRGSPTPHRDVVWAAAFSPDGTRFATGSADETACLGDAATGQPVGEPLRHNGPVRTAAFSPDGRLLATAGEDGTARLWEAATGAPHGSPMAHGGGVRHVAFSADGRLLATAGEDGTARLWDAASGRPVGNPLPHRDAVRSVAFHPRPGSADLLLTGCYDGGLRLWEVNRGPPPERTLTHDDAVQAVAFRPDGRVAVTAGDDRTARLWGVATGAPRGTPLRHQGRVEAVAFSPNGRLLATASADRTAQLWLAETGQPLPGPPLQHRAGVVDVAFSPDGKLVATASLDLTVRLWEAVTGRPVGGPLPQQSGEAEKLAFSPDGTWLAVVASDRRVRLWETATGRVHATLEHAGHVYAVAFAPDSRTCVTACEDRTARLWEAATGRPAGEPLGHPDRVLAAAFSPNGRTVATACVDGTARLWDAATCRPLGPPLIHQDRVLAVAFRPDGKVLATASEDRTARLWDAATGASLGLRLQHRNRVRAVAFSPDGRVLLTGSADGTARLWELPEAVSGEVGEIVTRTQVLTGLEMTAGGMVRVLDAPAWNERRAQLDR